MVVLISALVLAVPALAADNPVSAADDSGTTTPGVENDTATTTSIAIVEPQAGPEPPVIEVNILGEVDPDSAGALTPAEGGFGIDMWRGTPRAVVDRLLPRLPLGAPSPAMHALMRRLLLSIATVPEGDGERGALLAQRARLLVALGDLDGVARLVAATPAPARQGNLLHIDADARLLANDYTRACALASSNVGEEPMMYWQKTLVLCQALAGRHAEASLGLALLRELGEDDAAYFRLVEALGRGGDGDMDSAAVSQPLHLAMARAAQVRLTDDIAGVREPGLLKAIAVSPNATPMVRLEAAERAVGTGTLPAATLSALYAAVPFDEVAQDDLVAHAEKVGGPEGRAALYQAALTRTEPMDRIDLMRRLLASGRTDGRYATAAKGIADLVTTLSPTDDAMAFIAEAAGVALMDGRRDVVRQWRATLAVAAPNDPQAAKALARTEPLAILAGLTEPVVDAEPDVDDTATVESPTKDTTAAVLSAWWRAISEDEEDTAARARAARLFTVFEAMGRPVPAELWGGLLDGSMHREATVVDPVVWHGLENAAAGGRVGETMLMSLIALDDAGPGGADPIVLRRVLVGLRSVGLDEAAAALAVEALAAAGV